MDRLKMDLKSAETLVDALDAREGIVAVVGAGGKKTTLYRLLEAHRLLGTRRILLTSTVQIATAPAALDVETHITDSESARAVIAETQDRDGAFLIAGASEKPGRFSGLSPQLIPRLHEEGAFGVGLVKADGARMRMIKAPKPEEPALPDGVSTILPIVSARAFGRPLDQRIAHRPERLAELLDTELGAPITADHVARLLTSERGALRGCGNASVVPVINMVDDPERHIFARDVAEKALSMVGSATGRFERVVLASMTSPSPLVEMIGN